MDDSFSQLLENTDFKISRRNLSRFFRLAKAGSEASDYHKQKLGAVITYKNKVLVVGWNSEKETPMQKRFNKFKDFDTDSYKNTSHAEMNAVSKLMRMYNLDDIDISKLNIFVYRENMKTHKVALARPCVACMAMLRNTGIKHIYYTGNESIVAEVLS